jgi:protein-tyrosine phosphatase
MCRFIDLHCHVLPALDDGPPDVEESVELVRQLEQLGFGDFHPTPHQYAGRWTPEPSEREESASHLRSALAQANCAATIHQPAGENMWDELFLARQQDQSFPRYSGDRAFLLEFRPGSLPPHVAQRLFDIRLGGLLPVIAHVERYPEILERPGLFSGRAALLLNTSTLGGIAGWGIKRAARRLVRREQVHALATDAHGPADVPFTARGLAWLEREVGSDGMHRLLVEGPRTILTGEIPD